MLAVGAVEPPQSKVRPRIFFRKFKYVHIDESPERSIREKNIGSVKIEPATIEP